MNKHISKVLAGVMMVSLFGCASQQGTGASTSAPEETSEFSLNPAEAVTVTGGQITGEMSTREEGVAVYRGIPYAAAPEGELRWKAPQDVEAWEGVKECTEWGASAIQPEQAPFMMWSKEFIIEDTGYSEDCLNLNVWAKTDGSAKKPVLVYIHGGGFTSGGSSCDVYNGSYIAEQDVVFVSINYRVGVMGFLAHPELTAEDPEHASGNYGLMDQIKALEWVRDNISVFGGDPSKVTIMGQSAGSGAVHDLVLSPKAKGLFQQTVNESFNSVNSKLKTLAEAEEAGKEQFGDMTLEEMRALSADEVLAMGNSFAPIIDGEVLTEDYGEANLNGDVNEVTMMTGFVTGDTMLFSSIRAGEDGTYTLDSVKSQAETLFGDQADTFLSLYDVEADPASAVAQYNVDNMQALIDVLAAARSKGGQPKTYTYYFTHVMPGEGSEEFGAFHTADVPYFLGLLSDARKDYWTEEDRTLADTMAAYLVNFVKTGNPNGEGLVEWTENKDGEYLVLDAECKADQLSDAKRDFFKAVYADLRGE